ncbi:MAG: sulfatase-like hydrolase/transferase [Solirubrobacterales bacterium]
MPERSLGGNHGDASLEEREVSLKQKIASSLGAVLALAVLTVAVFTLGPDLFGSGSSSGSERAPAQPDPGTPVVLVILDEFPTASIMKPDQTVDANRFPNLARFAAGSTWYRDNAAAGDFTAWAVPPILTGNHTNENVLPTSKAQPDNIFNLLGPGRRVHGREELTELCPKKYCPGGHQGEFPEETQADDFIKAKFKLLDIGEIKDWISTIPSGRRTLSVIHLPLPHQPLLYLPNGQRYPGGPLGFTINPEVKDWEISDAGISLVHQRHLIQAGYADLMVGKIMDKIKKNGDFDKSLVIVTADHGVSYDARYDRRDVSQGSIGATLNPPLMIKYPHQKTGEVSGASTQNIDLVPTIAGVLGIENLYETDGVPIDQIPPDRQMVADKDLAKRIHFTAEDIREQRAELLRTQTSRFGNRGLFRLGPQSGLIGARPGRTPVLAGSTVSIDSARKIRDYKPREGYVPSLISGRLTGVKADQVVAVALNGRITGTTRTFEYEGRMRFGTMTKPTAIRPGSNRIAVYAVGPKGSLLQIPRERTRTGS